MKVFIVIHKGNFVMVDEVYEVEDDAIKRAEDIIKELYGVEAKLENGKYIPYNRKSDRWIEIVEKDTIEKSK